MASSSEVLSRPHGVAGIRLAAAASGARYQGRDDIALVEIPPDATVACVFTRNRFCAAPVTIAKRHLAKASPRYLVINAGNANAGTGDAGERAALAVCEAVAQATGVATDAVLPFSTGVIGAQMNVEAMLACIPRLTAALDGSAWDAAAAAILTTDTRVKVRSVRCEIDGHTVTVTGMAKGSGMIKPDMATMLAYVATDAAVAAPLLESLTREITQRTFNCVIVDGDTSTNDALAVIATGANGAPVIEAAHSAAAAAFAEALESVCRGLAQDIVRDGEGATKFVRVLVQGGDSDGDCRAVGCTVAESPLVKTALFASDPNWGRILAAIGRAPVTRLDIDAVGIAVGDVTIVRDGQPAPGYDESAAAAVMAAADIDIHIVLGAGPGKAEIWTCDLSYDYVRINAEYRS